MDNDDQKPKFIIFFFLKIHQNNMILIYLYTTFTNFTMSRTSRFNNLMFFNNKNNKNIQYIIIYLLLHIQDKLNSFHIYLTFPKNFNKFLLKIIVNYKKIN